MNCDRILVLKDGEIAVFDTFSNLMGNLEKLKNGGEVDGADGVRFFGEAIDEIVKSN